MSPADSPFAPLPAPGPHPAPAELRAYAAGTLSPADEHRIEAHTLDCERCADLLDGFSMSDAPTTDQAIAELRTRLQARIGAEEPAPVAGGWAWPRLAAAAALVAAVGGGIWSLNQHDTTPPATARLETVAPAAPAFKSPKPAASAPGTEAEVAVAPPATAAPTAASATGKTADYAAVSPAQMSRRSAMRPLARTRSAADDFADRAELNEMAPAPAVPPLATQAAPPAASEPASAADYASSGAAADKKREGLVSGRAAIADSTVALSEVMIANRMMKAKAAAPSAAPAIVANTPMPAGFTIKPAPVGGTPFLRDYLRREASQFVPEINNLRISGTVHLRFIVGADGKLNDLKVTRGMRKDYDDEALRLVCEGPAWQPGIAGGKRAPIPVELTVPF